MNIYFTSKVKLSYIALEPTLNNEVANIIGLYSNEKSVFNTDYKDRSIRNIEALATFREASVGVEYAEAFQAIKIID